MSGVAGTGDEAREWRRLPPTRRQQRADLAVGIGLALAALASFEVVRSLGWQLGEAPGRVEQTLWALGVTLPLCVRRRFPVAVLVAVAAVFIGLQARLILEGFVTGIALFLAVFTAGAWSSDRRVAGAARLVVVVAMFSWLGISLSTTAWEEVVADREDLTGLLPPATASLVYLTLTNVAYFTAAWIFGDRAWRHARDRAELVTRNAELAAQRHENARRAVVEERVRIARELHDVVAHHVSVMGVQAGAARHVLDRDPEAARGALVAIEESSRSAVVEMRRLLGVLRQGDPEPGDDGAGRGREEPAAGRTSLPGVADLPGLVGRLDRASLTAALTEIGDPRPLPAALSVSVYRVVQEALTNTVKHAHARRVDVRLRWLDAGVEVEVTDDGHGSAASPSTGMGLVGMRERVTLHRGELEAGPRAVGGYRVRARFPLPPAAARDGAARDGADDRGREAPGGTVAAVRP
ncbi:MAG: sensor histidine kinase [Kineosporiaceae bacterium]